MEIFFADGNKATLSEIRADVEAAKLKYGYRDFCFSYLTVEALLNKLEEALTGDGQKWTVFLHDGTSRVISGDTFFQALNAANIHTRTLDTYTAGVHTDMYVWDSAAQGWRQKKG